MRPIQNPESKVQALLAVRELRKAYRSASNAVVEVLCGLSFSVEAGEMLAIMGPSGSGKSTLLHLLGGLDAADGGSIHLDGFDVLGASAVELTRFRNREIGFVFQFHHLLPDLTAAENVALPLLINRTARRRALERACALLERMGLGERRGEQVGTLSGGEQQRVAVARAVITGPRLLLADEPTGNLDADSGREVGQLLNAFRREREAAIIIATHNEGLARVCDRVLHLSDGRLHEKPSALHLS